MMMAAAAKEGEKNFPSGDTGAGGGNPFLRPAVSLSTRRRKGKRGGRDAMMKMGWDGKSALSSLHPRPFIRQQLFFPLHSLRYPHYPSPGPWRAINDNSAASVRARGASSAGGIIKSTFPPRRRNNICPGRKVAPPTGCDEMAAVVGATWK